MAVVIKGSGSIEGTSGLEMGANGTTEIRGQVNVALGSSVAGISTASGGTVSSGIATATNFAPSSVPTGHRNLILNGAMKVAQYGTSISAEGYTCDRFNLLYTGTDEAPTLTQHSLSTSDTGPYEVGFRNSLHLQNGNQTSGAGAGDYMILRYKIEAQDIANSGWNYKSATSYLTLSYWVKSSVAQNFYGYMRSDDGTAQLYAWETGALTADTWTKITKKIPGQAAGNIDINDDNGIGMMITFPTWWGGNWTNNNTLNTWAAYDSANRTPDWTSTWYTTNDSTFEITGVQLEVGEVATPFEHRTYGDELARCMRYYQQWGATGQDGNFCVGASHLTSGGDQTRNASMLPTMLRAAPTITEFGNGLKVFGSGSEVSVTNIQDINVTNGSNMLCWTCEHTDIGDNNEVVVVCNTDNGGATLSAEL